MDVDRLFPATSMPDPDWWHVLWPDPTQVLIDVGITEEMSVVDLCCGDGYFTRAMCELSSTGLIYALDIDQELLTKAEQLCSGFNNFRSITADARDLPSHILDLVDFVFIANTFHGVPNQLELSKSIYKTLNKTGRFTVINWYKRPRVQTPVLGQPRGPDEALRMQPEQVQDVVEPAGFKLDTLLNIGPYHYATVFKKS